MINLQQLINVGRWFEVLPGPPMYLYAVAGALFLLPRVNARLMPKLKRELRPGTRIVSHQFDMGDEWPPEQSQDVDGLTIYLWTIR